MKHDMRHFSRPVGLFFVDTLWPDCDMALLTRIAEAFVQRRRRFGT